MSFTRYPSYQRTNVELLGTVPTNWNVLPVKRDIEFITSGSRGWAGNYSDEGELFLRIANLTRDSIRLDLSEIQRVEVSDGVEGSRTKVQPGDILFSITAYLGSVAVVPVDLESAYVSQHVALVRLAGRMLTPQWVGYATLSFVGKSWLEMQSYGGTKVQLSLDDVRSLPIPIPPIDEQTQIAAFLDRETAKIDALVAEQRRLMELLKEKRQAVISHAVTKGLNPDAPMKPSGIEWLGDVPAHWSTGLLKRAFRSVDYGISDSLDADGAVAILRMGNIQGGQISLDDLKYTNSVDPSLILQQDDLLYNRTNSLDLIGKVGLFQHQTDSPISFASYLVRLRVVETSFPAFFAYLLNTEGVLGLARASAFVSIGQCNLNPTRYGMIEVALPPRNEQSEIVQYLDVETTKLDALTAEAQRAIDLLQERRTALISAAVTGQIDVRGLASPEAA